YLDLAHDDPSLFRGGDPTSYMVGGGPATRRRYASAAATIDPISNGAGTSSPASTGELFPLNHFSIPAGAKLTAIREIGERTRYACGTPRGPNATFPGSRSYRWAPTKKVTSPSSTVHTSSSRSCTCSGGACFFVSVNSMTAMA